MPKYKLEIKDTHNGLDYEQVVEADNEKAAREIFIQEQKPKNLSWEIRNISLYEKKEVKNVPKKVQPNSLSFYFSFLSKVTCILVFLLLQPRPPVLWVIFILWWVCFILLIAVFTRSIWKFCWLILLVIIKPEAFTYTYVFLVRIGAVNLVWVAWAVVFFISLIACIYSSEIKKLRKVN